MQTHSGSTATMEASSVLLLMCILGTCSVWTVHGASLEVNIDDQEHQQVDVDVDISLPGVCWVCKWTLNKVKKALSHNGTAERVKAKLLSCCEEIGILKSLCRRFVKKHLGELIEELTTTDDVKTICVNTGACKPKELWSLRFVEMEDSSSEANDYP
ncbi:NK-lysin tandem duplicate 4 isoform X2 [Labrus mixtus]|uniref:NK-lysin tandem duplicate 4 isoform X2 n=1 Tax=Labrus mixtus TaxID=508554 RepID=UPI0029BFAF57|nr:NK-lysin tandem duplicate 4 isoform X2 [Labrus mixtus]